MAPPGAIFRNSISFRKWEQVSAALTIDLKKFKKKKSHNQYYKFPLIDPNTFEFQANVLGGMIYHSVVQQFEGKP